MTDDQLIQDHGTPEEHRPDHGDRAAAAMPVEAPRRASLTLRADDAREQRAASMEAANKSLADALRITYRLILALMVALVFVFIFTGVKQVNESEVGVKVTFGKITARALEPGAHFNLPFPLGEIISVSQSQKSAQIDRAFLPTGFNPSQPLEDQGYGSTSLRPGIDGSLLTADGSLVHARLSIAYRIADADRYLANIDPDHEARIIKAVVERATVRVVANATIDELLSRASGSTAGSAGDTAPSRAGGRAIEQRIRDAAQSALDRMDVGIEISETSLTNLFPPLRVYTEFQRVNQVDAEASRAREEAEERRRRRLNAVAGSAYRPLLDLIADYENHLALDDQDKAEAGLEEISAVLAGKRNGRDVRINGRTYPEVVVAGEAARRISTARRTRQVLVSGARRKAAIYQAKLEQYRANPTAFVAREVSEALREFIAENQIQQFFVPSASDFQLMLNNDPEIARALQRARQQRLTDEFLRGQGELE